MTETNSEHSEHNEPWRQFWGDDAARDLAEDLEQVYEKDTGKSCVYWNSPDKEIQRSTDLPRSEGYDTEGWTLEYEHWGVEMISKACRAGMTDSTSVLEWIRRDVELREAGRKSDGRRKADKVDEIELKYKSVESGDYFLYLNLYGKGVCTFTIYSETPDALVNVYTDTDVVRALQYWNELK